MRTKRPSITKVTKKPHWVGTKVGSWCLLPGSTFVTVSQQDDFFSWEFSGFVPGTLSRISGAGTEKTLARAKRAAVRRYRSIVLSDTYGGLSSLKSSHSTSE